MNTCSICIHRYLTYHCDNGCKNKKGIVLENIHIEIECKFFEEKLDGGLYAGK